MKPQMPVDNHEAEMARADLYKMAKYSMKLFQMIQEGQELEGWVQSKITKASDYISSIYHYMEYQMKFGNGMPAESVDDITREAGVIANQPVAEEDDEIAEGLTYEQRLHALLEGRVKKAKEGNAFGKAVQDAKAKGSKTASVGGKTVAVKEGERTMSRAAKGVMKYGKDGMQALAKAGKEGKDLDKIRDKYDKYDESAKPDFLDMDKDGDKKEPMKKAVADKKAGPKKGVNPFAKKTAKVKEGMKAGEEKSLPFDPDPKPIKKVTPGKHGQGYSQARHLARQGLQKTKKVNQ